MNFTDNFINNLKFNKEMEETVGLVYREILEEIKKAVVENSELGISLDKMVTTERNVYGFELKAMSHDKILIKITVRDVLNGFVKRTQSLPTVVSKEAVENTMRDIILNQTTALNIFR
ncbi:hypothetical protein [Desulfosporosinus fructosivorans]